MATPFWAGVASKYIVWPPHFWVHSKIQLNSLTPRVFLTVIKMSQPSTIAWAGRSLLSRINMLRRIDVILNMRCCAVAKKKLTRVFKHLLQLGGGLKRSSGWQDVLARLRRQTASWSYTMFELRCPHPAELPATSTVSDQKSAWLMGCPARTSDSSPRSEPCSQAPTLPVSALGLLFGSAGVQEEKILMRTKLPLGTQNPKSDI